MSFQTQKNEIFNMNILFYTHGKVYATRGGTERTTISVASALTQQYGCRCFSLYEAEEAVEKEKCFVAEFRWQAGRDRQRDIETLHRIIVENDIDCIIDQGIFINVGILREATDGTSCKVILAHHYEPGAETLYMSLRRHWAKRHNKMSIRRRCKWLFDLVFYPYSKHKYVETLRRTYREAYFQANRVVLLSHEFIRAYQEFGQFNDNKNFSVIPNSLSFNEFLPTSDIIKKQPIVLIVSRIEEVHKRLSLALKIWAKVKSHSEAQKWTLKIVGTGNDMPSYLHMVEHDGIPDVVFEGHQNPIPYYKEASIFMMTSRSESWGLTLTEAQQMGVVPIAFNTYASLLDIISDDKDGVVIEEGDIDGYVSHILDLMRDNNKRQRMAWQAISSSHRFTQDKVAEMWWKLLSGL